MSDRHRFAKRLESAGVRVRRFIDVRDGEKGSRVPGHQNPENWKGPDGVSGNYGIHPGYGLIELDIDDYDGDRETPALDSLADTFAVVSPHSSEEDPGHRYYRIDGGDAADAFKEVGKPGASYLALSWGEVKREGAYTVGPGSQLNSCDKEWHDCSDPDNGYYSIGEDRPIAEITKGELVAVLREDPNIETGTGRGSESDTGGTSKSVANSSPKTADVDVPLVSPDEKPLCYHNALKARETGRHAVGNSHEVNLILSNLGVNLGYDTAEIVEHCRNHTGTSTNFDRDLTRKGVEGSRSKAERGDLNPPNTKTLQAAGILPSSGCDSDCPIHGTRFGTEYIPILPKTAAGGARAARGEGSSTWRWWNADVRAGEEGEGLTQTEARRRTAETLNEAFEGADNALIDALPTLGKSYNAIQAAADTETPTTILTSRGRREQYDQFTEWAEDRGLRVAVLPSVWKSCGCFTGEHGSDVKDRVSRWYRSGATGKDIHAYYETATGNPIPCDGPAGDRCGFKSAWQADFEEYDVLLGSYVHGHVSSAVKGRTVVIDEFPREAFENHLGGSRLDSAMTVFLNHNPGVPYDDAQDLRENRGDDVRRRDALEYFSDLEADGEEAVLRSRGHADAKAAVYTILAAAEGGEVGTVFGNGWERASLPGTDGDIGLFNRENGSVTTLRRADFSFARNVIALDGTPKKRMWETVQRGHLNHRRVLSDGERRKYLRDCLNLNFVRTTDFMKPYNTASNVFAREDAALLEGIYEREGERPAVLTTATAENVHEDAGLYQRTNGDGVGVEPGGLASAVAHYGDLKGSNRFASKRVGAVLGSNNFGDDFPQKWGAIHGVEVVRDPDGGRGTALRFTEVGENAEGSKGIGQAAYEHMTEDETLQAALRFGRDGGGATTYLHTAALPDLLEDAAVSREGKIVRVHSKGTRGVVRALKNLEVGEEPATTKVVSSKVDVSTRQVRNILNDLEGEGVIRREDPSDRRGLVWFDPAGELANLGDFGAADLPTEKRPELTADALVHGLPENSGSSTYTWNFRLERAALSESGGDRNESAKSVVSVGDSAGR